MILSIFIPEIAWMFAITVFIAFVVILIVFYIKGRVQSNMLNIKCDPEKYLELIDKQEKRYQKNKSGMNYLAINRSVGHLLLGDIFTAKEYLMEVDTSCLSERNMSYLIYTIDLILCHYMLGEIEQAERLYETNMVRLSPLGKRYRIIVDLLIGERYYFLGKYSLSYEYLSKIPKYDLNKRQYLSVLYTLAKIDVMNGDIEQAVIKLQKVVKNGNKLYIVKESQEILENLKTELSQ